MGINSVLVLCVALGLSGVLALHPRLRRSRWWRATVTPLASIMGSGFLVSAPLLVALVGAAAPLAMAGLLLVAFLLGALIRFNIRVAEPVEASALAPQEHRYHQSHAEHARWSWAVLEASAVIRVERASQLVLTGAYIISVSYYLQLFSAFVLHMAGSSSETAARLITTAILLTIASIGAWRGLSALERVEEYAVALNLGTIGALLVGLLVYDTQLWLAGGQLIPDLPVRSDPVHIARSLMGLLIVVQGFETSRFLGSDHPAGERISTMRAAQLIATGVYLIFLTLALALFSPDAPVSADVTAIISLVAPVALVLPALITLAAAGSQISAAVADDAGCSGLLQGLLAGRVPSRLIYALLGGVMIALTWGTDVLQVISIASRAFALYYALQCAVAALTAARQRGLRHRAVVMVGATLMGLLCLAITALGIPAE